MNSQDAHDLLNAVRDGAQFCEADIVEALQATGDVDLPDYPVVRYRKAGTWEQPMRRQTHWWGAEA